MSKLFLLFLSEQTKHKNLSNELIQVVIDSIKNFLNKLSIFRKKNIQMTVTILKLLLETIVLNTASQQLYSRQYKL